jgi:hypothetical protein
MAVWVSLAFQDATPFTATSPTNAHSDDPLVLDDGMAHWSYSRVAPGGGNGGYSDRGYVDYTWSYTGALTLDSGWTDSGYPYIGAGTEGQDLWPDTFYGRCRIYFVNGIDSVETEREFKWFIWHQGDAGSTHRVVGFLEKGSISGGSDATSVTFTIGQNIFTEPADPKARVNLPVGEWIHLQWSWTHNVDGTGAFRIWVNNNVSGSPDDEDTTITGWNRDNSGYDGQWYIANCANNGTAVDEPFNYRLMDFELGDSFDNTWTPSAAVVRGANPLLVLM